MVKEKTQETLKLEKNANLSIKPRSNKKFICLLALFCAIIFIMFTILDQGDGAIVEPEVIEKPSDDRHNYFEVPKVEPDVNVTDENETK